MPNTIYIREDDTEPLEVVVDAHGVSNLDDLSTAVMYLDDSSGATHVDGASMTVSSSGGKRLSFDPVGNKSGGGNALDSADTYSGYVKLTWTDGDITHHPGDGDLVVVVRAN